MDLWHNGIQNQDLLFSPAALAIGMFGFLAIANAFVGRHSRLHWLQRGNVSLPICDQSKFICSSFNSIYPKQARVCPELRDADECQAVTSNAWGHMDAHRLRAVMMLSFYVGYATSHLFSTALLKLLGGKWIVVIDLTLVALLATITPYVILTFGSRGIIYLRLLMGLSEGSLFPAWLSLTSQQMQNFHNLGRDRRVYRMAGSVAVLGINLLATIFMRHMERSASATYFLGTCAAFWFLSILIFIFFKSPSAEPLHCSSIQTSDIFDSGSCPSLLSLITTVAQNEWLQSLICTEIRSLMDGMNQDDVWNFYVCVKIMLPFLMSWMLAIVADLLGNIMVMSNILNAMEAENLRGIVASFGPKLCYDFAACLMSIESRGILTSCNCALGAISAYYMSLNLNSFNANAIDYGGTLMDVANDLDFLMTIMSPYMEELLGEERSLDHVWSLIYFIRSLLGVENGTTPADSRFHMAVAPI